MSPDPVFRTTIRLRGVSREFRAGAGSCTAGVTALDGVSVEIRGGEILLVCGPRGAGKTTLLLCAAGMLHFDAGTVAGNRPRVVYRDLAHPAPSLDGWPAGGAILLDSCDDVDDLIRPRAAHAIGAALATGSAVVLASRAAESAFALAPATATISVLHLRRGRIDGSAERGVVHRVAEAGGGGY